MPAIVLKLMLGEMSIEILKSAWVSGQKIIEEGYQFRYATIDRAITQLLA